MNQKHIGIVLILVGLIVAGFTFSMKAREDALIDAYVRQVIPSVTQNILK